MNQAVIDIQGITKTYVNGKLSVPVLHGIDLQVNKGEFVSIMGPSGSGKSTFMNILGCLDRPTTGSYRLNGDEVATLSDDELAFVRNKQIGFVFQSFNLIEEMNVFENVELPLTYMKIKPSERKRRVEETLKRMSIDHRAGHFPTQLSGGQQQRVAIARAVVINPMLILADEPTGNLDSRNGQDVMELLLELNRQGTTIVMVTHSRHDASYAHRIINLFDGQIVTEVQSESLLR